ncbi:MAG: amidohydrolase family protein [Microthrixaceae bacterium]
MSEGRLVRGAHVLTAAEPGELTDAAVRVVGDRIAAIGSYDDLRRAHPDDEVTGGPHDLVTPGFVNTHGHFSETLITGIAEQHTLWEWVHAVINPVNPHLTDEMAYVGSTLGAIQMLRSGITVANDMFVCDPVAGPVTPGVVRALDEVGLRGVVSFGASDLGEASVEQVMDEHEALRAAAEASRLSTFRVGISAVGAQTPAMLDRSVELALGCGCGVHTHLQEIREEVTEIHRLYGATPIAHCEHIGLFQAPTIAAHCVWVDAADREILAANGVGVAHNPVSNMILASGVCPVPELRRLGVPVGIGVDGPASNDSQNFLECLKSAILMQRLDQLQATAFSAREAFAMATIDGARSLRLDHEVGSIEVGKAADLVVFDGDHPAMANVHDPYQKIAYCSSPDTVRDVWVAGRRSVEDGRVVTVDVARTVDRSRELSRDLVTAAGLGRYSLLADPVLADAVGIDGRVDPADLDPLDARHTTPLEELT